MTLRDDSKQNYGAAGARSHNIPNADINTGSFQRIADACELMAKDHRRLRDELAYYQSAHEASCAWVARLRRQVAGLKGVITKLKRKGKVKP